MWIKNSSILLQFVISIEGEGGEGLYNLYFHNCAELSNSLVTLNVRIGIINKPIDNEKLKKAMKNSCVNR